MKNLGGYAVILNESYKLIMLNENYVDVNLSMLEDTPLNKDPDTYSYTLNKYHETLWNKMLPNGKKLNLMSNSKKPYYLVSKEFNMRFSSDNIIHTYSKWESMYHIISQIDKQYIDETIKLGTTIGGYIIFPSNKINNKITINAIRGMHGLIRDRFDLTLECIRRYYLGIDNPLNEHFIRYKDFFDLFIDFKGYVDFFLLNDLVKNNYEEVCFFMSFEDFDTNNVLPKDKKAYMDYMEKVRCFV